MKIVIKEENKTKLWIGIPSCLLFNGFTAIFAKKALQKEDGIKISRKQLAKFFKERFIYISAFANFFSAQHINFHCYFLLTILI